MTTGNPAANRRMKIRLTALAVAMALMVGLVAWTAHSSWLRTGELREKLTALEEFLRPKDLVDKVRGLVGAKGNVRRVSNLAIGRPIREFDLGNEHGMSFTVIGDTVNTASRLQDVTRSLGTPLVVSDELVRKIGEASDAVVAVFLFMLLDRLRKP